MNFFVGAFYDGVYLLGIALNETLAEGGDIRDGISITRRMWDRDFIGITGHVRIDDNGDRGADYSILDLDPITGRSFEHSSNSLCALCFGFASGSISPLSRKLYIMLNFYLKF